MAEKNKIENETAVNPEVKKEEKTEVKNTKTAKDKAKKEKDPKKSKRKKRRTFGLHFSIPAMACGPVLIFGILAMIICATSFSTVMYEKVEKELKDVASSILLSYDLLYPGEFELIKNGNMVAFYKGETEVTGHYEIIDSYKANTGAEISIFYRDTRMVTTLVGENNLRLVGSGVNAVVKQAVIDGRESKFYKKVNINDNYYYVYYEPIFSSGGGVVGMIAIAKNCKDIDALVIKSLSPMLLFIAVFMIVVALIAYFYTAGLANSIESIEKTLSRIAKGDLTGDVDYKLLSRNDEIADIGKSIRSMQNSLHILVEKDALTELFNRRLANKRLEKAIKEEREMGINYCVALCDIDFFKKVNDNYGHDMGDAVLKEVAKVLKANMVGMGVASRWGGEEFLLIFNDMGIGTAYKITEKILNDIRALEIENNGGMSEEELFGAFIAGKNGEIEIIEDDGSETEQYLEVEDAYIPFIKVTMSIGLVKGGSGRTQDEVIKMADDNLYYGKENGRNQIVAEGITEIIKKDEDEENI